jgi:hypothetical protein
MNFAPNKSNHQRSPGKLFKLSTPTSLMFFSLFTTVSARYMKPSNKSHFHGSQPGNFELAKH